MFIDVHLNRIRSLPHHSDHTESDGSRLSAVSTRDTNSTWPSSILDADAAAAADEPGAAATTTLTKGIRLFPTDWEVRFDRPLQTRRTNQE